MVNNKKKHEYMQANSHKTKYANKMSGTNFESDESERRSNRTRGPTRPQQNRNKGSNSRPAPPRRIPHSKVEHNKHMDKTRGYFQQKFLTQSNFFEPVKNGKKLPELIANFNKTTSDPRKQDLFAHKARKYLSNRVTTKPKTEAQKKRAKQKRQRLKVNQDNRVERLASQKAGRPIDSEELAPKLYKKLRSQVVKRNPNTIKYNPKKEAKRPNYLPQKSFPLPSPQELQGLPVVVGVPDLATIQSFQATQDLAHVATEVGTHLVSGIGTAVLDAGTQVVNTLTELPTITEKSVKKTKTFKDVEKLDIDMSKLMKGDANFALIGKTIDDFNEVFDDLGIPNMKTFGIDFYAEAPQSLGDVMTKISSFMSVVTGKIKVKSFDLKEKAICSLSNLVKRIIKPLDDIKANFNQLNKILIGILIAMISLILFLVIRSETNLFSLVGEWIGGLSGYMPRDIFAWLETSDPNVQAELPEEAKRSFLQNMISVVKIFLIPITGASWYKHKWELERFIKAGYVVRTIESVVAFFKKCVEFIMNNIYCFFTGVPWLSAEQNLLRKELSELSAIWLEKTQNIDDMARTTVPERYTIQSTIHDFKKTYTRAVRAGLSPAALNNFRVVYKQIQDTQLLFNTCPCTEPFRAVPVVVWFAGKPGSGKSLISGKLTQNLAEFLAKELNAYIDKKNSELKDGEPLRRRLAMNDLVYPWPDDRFMDRYNAIMHLILKVDDALQNPTPNERAAFMEKFVKYVSNEPYYPAMGTLELKNSVALNFKLVVCTTNLLNYDHSSLKSFVTDGAAMRRRLDFIVQPIPNPDLTSNTIGFVETQVKVWSGEHFKSFDDETHMTVMTTEELEKKVILAMAHNKHHKDALMMRQGENKVPAYMSEPEYLIVDRFLNCDPTCDAYESVRDLYREICLFRSGPMDVQKQNEVTFKNRMNKCLIAMNNLNPDAFRHKADTVPEINDTPNETQTETSTSSSAIGTTSEVSSEETGDEESTDSIKSQYHSTEDENEPDDQMFDDQFLSSVFDEKTEDSNSFGVLGDDKDLSHSQVMPPETTQALTVDDFLKAADVDPDKPPSTWQGILRTEKDFEDYIEFSKRKQEDFQTIWKTLKKAESMSPNTLVKCINWLFEAPAPVGIGKKNRVATLASCYFKFDSRPVDKPTVFRTIIQKLSAPFRFAKSWTALAIETLNSITYKYSSLINFVVAAVSTISMVVITKVILSKTQAYSSLPSPARKNVRMPTMKETREVTVQCFGDAISDKIQSNLVNVTLPTGTRTLAFMLTSQFGFIPKHALARLRAGDVQVGLKTYENVVYTTHTDKVHFKSFDTVDLAMFFVEKALPSIKSLSPGLFISHKMLLSAMNGGFKRVEPTMVRYFSGAYLATGIKKYAENCPNNVWIRFNLPGAVGVCASIYQSCEDRYQNKILGIHHSGDTISVSYACPLTSELVRDVYDAMLASPQSALSDEFMNETKRQWERTPVVQYQSSRCKIVSTIFQKEARNRGIPITKSPALLTGGEVFQNSLKKKLANPPVDIKLTHHYQKAKEFVINFLSQYAPQNFPTQFEMLNGNGVVPPVQVSTGSGINFQQKMVYLNRDDVDNSLSFTPEAAQLFEQFENYYRHGLEHPQYPCIIQDCLKDETLPLRKIIDKISRIMGPAPFFSYLLERLTNMNVATAISLSRQHGGPIDIGMNYGSDWTIMCKTKLEHCDSDHFVVAAGDLKNCDGSIPAPMFDVISDITVALLPQNDPHQIDNFSNVIKFLNDLLGKNCKHQLLDVLYTTTGNPSGRFMTTIVNSLTVWLVILVTYMKANPKWDHDELEQLTAHCCIFGDDHVVCLPRDNMPFDMFDLQAEFARLGMTYTSIYKDRSLVPFFEFDETLYLQRKFVKDGPIFHAPLNDETLTQMLFWTRDTEPSPQREIELLESYLRECVHKGKTFFLQEQEKYTSMLKEYFPHAHVPLLDYDQINAALQDIIPY